MWPLIKREAKDVILFAALPSLLITIMMIYLILNVYYHNPGGNKPFGVIPKLLINTWWLPLIVMPVVAALLGLNQMRWDRARGITTFLATQPTSRERLLIAKFLCGLVCLIAWYGSLTLVYIWTNDNLMRIPGSREYIIKAMSLCALFAWTAYTLGILFEKFQYLLICIFVTLLLLGLLFFMISLKGIIVQSYFLFAAISLAAMFRIWRRFMTVPL